MLPDFIIAGTFPAGTGHLYSLLIQHPEAYLPQPMQPECNFFFKSGEYAKGIAYYERTWFSAVAGQKAVGERSSLLLSGMSVAERVVRHLPRVRLIFLFRNPVDRAYANYRFTALAGYENLSFEEALDQEEERMAAQPPPFWSEIQPYAYFHRGLYADQLAGWLRFFPPDQMLLMRSDEFLKDYVGAMKRVFAFLGIDTAVVPRPMTDLSSPAVKDVRLQLQMRKDTLIGFDWAIQRLREGKPPEGELDVRIRENVMDGYPPLAPNHRARLTERYRDANWRLARMVPFSIEDWL